MARFEEVAEAAQPLPTGHTLLAYARGAGIDARWLVIHGDAEFFAITKRIDNGLYGYSGDEGPLGEPVGEGSPEAVTGYCEQAVVERSRSSSCRG